MNQASFKNIKEKMYPLNFTIRLYQNSRGLSWNPAQRAYWMGLTGDPIVSFGYSLKKQTHRIGWWWYVHRPDKCTQLCFLSNREGTFPLILSVISLCLCPTCKLPLLSRACQSSCRHRRHVNSTCKWGTSHPVLWIRPGNHQKSSTD